VDTFNAYQLARCPDYPTPPPWACRTNLMSELPSPAASDTITAAAGATTDGISAVGSGSAASAESVKIQFKAVGGAPILRKNKFKLGGDESFAAIIAFLRRQLQMSDTDMLFCYLMSAFAPAPSQKVAQLADTFAVDGELIVNYSITPAYG
jgi:ubiquitin-like protein ATG12